MGLYGKSHPDRVGECKDGDLFVRKDVTLACSTVLFLQQDVRDNTSHPLCRKYGILLAFPELRTYLRTGFMTLSFQPSHGCRFACVLRYTHVVLPSDKELREDEGGTMGMFPLNVPCCPKPP